MIAIFNMNGKIYIRYQYEYFQQLFYMQSSQLEKLKNACSEMQLRLQKFKEAANFDQVCSHYDNPIDYYIEAIECKNLMKNLEETQEMYRELIENKKEINQQSNAYLEGLSYYKEILQDKIRDLQVYLVDVDVDEYVEDEIGEVNWNEEEDDSLDRLKGQIVKIKEKTRKFSKIIKKKQILQEEIECKLKVREEKLDTDKLARLKQQILELSNLYNIQDIERSLLKITNEKLSQIYTTFGVIKQDQPITVSYKSQQFEFLEISLSEHSCQQLLQELKLDFTYIENRFIITTLHEEKQLYVGVHKDNQHSVKEIFNRLIENEPVDENSFKIHNFELASFSWLGETLLTSTNEIKTLLKKLKERIFCLQLNKFILKNMGKLIDDPRIRIISVQNVSFESYLLKIHIPNILKKYIEDGNCEKSQSSMQWEDIEKIFFKFNLEDYIFKNYNQYYELTIHYRHIKILVIFIIPYSYPVMPSIVRIQEVSDSQKYHKLQLRNIKCRLERQEANSNLKANIPLFEKQLNQKSDIVVEDKPQLQLYFQVQKLLFKMKNFYHD